MRIDLAEAVRIFGKWYEGRQLIRCRVVFGGFNVALNARVFSVSNERVAFVSNESSTELAMMLESVLEFHVADPGTLPAETTEANPLLALFSPKPRVGFPEMITFSELQQIPVE